MSNAQLTLDAVRNYYGRVLSTTQDLQTNACCAIEALPPHLAKINALLHDEVKAKFYGCGLPLPAGLTGATVVDLGCGSGRDTFILSKLVGETGKVIGVDMTPEQLSVAERHLEHHRKAYGYARSNVKLLSGYIEDLAGAGIASNSVDLVVSNCVINLSPDKRRVFSEALRVLKPGGELYFSDVFSGQRVPPELVEDPVLLGECLGGVLYLEDFRRLLGNLGCLEYRVVSKRVLELGNAEIERKVGMIDFYSVTVRAFKLPLEDRSEDYGQVATYRGTLEESPHAFTLDDHHVFRAGLPTRVCGNTAAMLSETRFGPHFQVAGDRSRHFGPFDATPVLAGASTASAPAAAPSTKSSCC